jgi:hypothetical protein
MKATKTGDLVISHLADSMSITAIAGWKFHGTGATRENPGLFRGTAT